MSLKGKRECNQLDWIAQVGQFLDSSHLSKHLMTPRGKTYHWYQGQATLQIRGKQQITNHMTRRENDEDLNENEEHSTTAIHNEMTFQCILTQTQIDDYYQGRPK